MDTVVNQTNLNQPLPYPQNPFSINDMHAASFYARSFHPTNIPLGFDSQFHPYQNSNQHQLEPLNRLAP
jgi:hypothetical protein